MTEIEAPRGNPRIAPTAYFTAQAWARGGFARAELFDTWLGRALYDGYRVSTLPARAVSPALGRFVAFLWLRHQWIEARLREIAPETVVEIGAGLSPRGLAWAEADPTLTYIELDLPALVAEKRRRLRGRTPPSNYRLASVDLLAPGFVDDVMSLLGGNGRVAVVTEGVCDYLDFPEKRIAWANIRALLAAAGGGRYLLEVHPRERFAVYGPAAQALVRALGLLTGRDFGERLYQRSEDACAALEAAGFDAARLLDTDTLDAGTFTVPPEGRYFDLIEAEVA